MAFYLGIDTSNYTTSAALYNTEGGEVIQRKKLLPVADGKIGLRQSDAVFAHVKSLGGILGELFSDWNGSLAAVGVSSRPTDETGSYMPCFLTGEMAADAIASSHKIPLRRFSHQAGHIVAALYSTGYMNYMEHPFLAFHVSGGTTQCLTVIPEKNRTLGISCVCKTLDLHAGQVIDRAGNMLNIPFPAGPGLEKLAMESVREFTTKPAFKGMDCCLSGVENQCRAMLDKGELPCDIARYCLDYIASSILKMTRDACKVFPGLPLVYAGGVMSNTIIRAVIENEFECSFAPPAFSTDNAVGIAVLASLAE